MPTEQITINTELLETEAKKCEEFISAIKERIATPDDNLFYLYRIGDLGGMILNEIKLVHLKDILSGKVKLQDAIFDISKIIKHKPTWTHHEVLEQNALKQTLALLIEANGGRATYISRAD